MEFFIAVGVLLFMALFFVMSLPLDDALEQVEPDKVHDIS